MEYLVLLRINNGKEYECQEIKIKTKAGDVMKYKFEFENPDFEKGDCDICPLSYTNWESSDWDRYCVLHYNYKDCPLEVAKEADVHKQKKNTV